MKKSLSAIIAGLLAILLVFTGCDRVAEELDQRFPEITADEDAPTEEENPLPDRVGRTYTVLLTTQLESAEQLTGVSLLTFHTADGSIHWLEIPSELFIHAAGNHLRGHYNQAYRAEMTKAGATSVSATRAGVAALRMLLSTGFNIPIDYFVNFNADQLSDFIKEIDNIPITLPESMGGFAAGDHTLTAKSAMEFLTYARHKDPVNGKLMANMQFASAFWQQARTVITADNLSLYSMEIRGMMTTDIPNTGGEDMFFLRRFLRAEPEAFSLTYLNAKAVHYGGMQCNVLVKNNALEQLNQQMLVYKEPLMAEQFDPSGVFVDHANHMVATVYTTSTPLPTLYTMAKLLNLDTPPQTDAGESES